jgi:tRNA threonylcarbamoyladenosine biosynthesis protein TsaE
VKPIEVNSLNDLPAAAKQLMETFKDKKVFAFYGQMGAGKTTFIKAICNELGVHENTSSPTFSIVNEYRANETVVYHFDFYRLKNEQEAFDLGYEEYFYSGAYCFIEWPEKIPSLLPQDIIKIDIHASGPDSRTIRFME